MKLVIHIGNHKAGSSTIQTGLDENRDTLLEYGALYPKTALITCAHHNLPFSMQGQASGFVSKKKPESLEYYRDEIINEAKSHKVDTVVVSSEEFMKFNENDITDFSRFTDKFNEVKVIVYLRNHINLIESAYKFNVLWEVTSDVSPFKEHLEKNLSSDYHEYDKRIEPWLLLHNNMTVVVKNFHTEIKKGLMENFLKEIGANGEYKLITNDKVVNSSLTRLGTLLLRANNRETIYHRDVLIEKIRLMESNNRLVRKEMLYTPEQFKQTIDRFTMSNQKLKDRFGIDLNHSVNKLDSTLCRGESYTDCDMLKLIDLELPN